MFKYVLLFAIIIVNTTLLKAQKDTVLNIDRAAKESQSNVFIDVDQKPEFPGGKDALMEFYKKTSNLEICNKSNNCKTIYYQIIVDEMGNIESFNIIKGFNKMYDDETRRIVQKMPRWKPGRKGGTSVKVLVTLSVKYKNVE